MPHVHVKKCLRMYTASGDAWENGTVGPHSRIKSRLQRLGYRRVSRRVHNEIPVEVEQLRHSGIAPLKKELRLTRGSAGPPFDEWPTFQLDRPDSVALAQGTYAAFCAVASCVSGVYGVIPWNTQLVDVPSVPGSSGSPRLISCKVVPSCRNEKDLPRGRRSAAPNPPTTPKCAVPREMAFRYVELWPPHTPRQRFAEKSNGLLGTRDTSRPTLCHQPWDSRGTMGFRGTEGLPS